jgi:protein TonB
VILPFPAQKPRRTGIAVTACAHLLAGWALWTLALSPQVPALAEPLWVALVTAEPPRPEPERPQPKPRPQPAPTLPQWAAPLPLPEIVPIATPTPAPAAPPPVAEAVVEPAAPVATPPPPRPAPSPPPPKLLRADQVRYLVMPPAEVPLLSKRAGEHGVVWLRVRIDAQGRPARIGLHRSSGFKRLDEQAMAAMAQARFAPQLEDGVAVEVEVIAPIDYPAD